MDNIREYLNWKSHYYLINREERNLTAILYHLLLTGDNLRRFLEMIPSRFEVKPEEVEVYFEYAFLRDLWWTEVKDNEKRRELICRFLRPYNSESLKLMSILDFNRYFGATPRPSNKEIQYPGKWSIGSFKSNISDKDEIRKVCKFKWAFNIKPDIVIQPSKNCAICLEAKFESIEGTYPTKPQEVALFKERGLLSEGQTSLQKYMMEELLGFDTEFVFLVQNPDTRSPTHTNLFWKDVFTRLDTAECPPFVQTWLKYRFQLN